MKTLYTFLFTIIAISLNAAEMQIHAHHNSSGAIDSYEVHTWNGTDGSFVVTKYTIEEAQSKFGKLLDATEAGTSKTPDRITVIYNNSTGEVEKVTSQVLAVPVNGTLTGKLEDKPKTQSELSETVKTDASTAKEDIETKTGKELDGDPK